jgi:hypothetical protein
MQETCEEKLHRLSNLVEVKENSVKSAGHSVPENLPSGLNQQTIPSSRDRSSSASASKDEHSNGRKFQDVMRSNIDRTQSPVPMVKATNELSGSAAKSTVRRRFADSDSDDDLDTIQRHAMNANKTSLQVGGDGTAVSTGNPNHKDEPVEAAVHRPVFSSQMNPAASTSDKSAHANSFSVMMDSFADVALKGSIASRRETLPVAGGKVPQFPHPILGAPKTQNQDTASDKSRRDAQGYVPVPNAPRSTAITKGPQQSTGGAYQRGTASQQPPGANSKYFSPSRSHSPSNRSMSPAGGRSERSISRAGSRRRSFRIDSDSDSDEAPSSMMSEQDRRRSAPISRSVPSGAAVHSVAASRSSGQNPAGRSQHAVKPSAGPMSHAQGRVHDHNFTEPNPVARDSRPSAAADPRPAAEPTRPPSAAPQARHSLAATPAAAPKAVVAAPSSEPVAAVGAGRAGPRRVAAGGVDEAGARAAAGAVLRVRKGCEDGSAFPSIMGAVDAAFPGQTVHIEAGSYAEELRIDKPLQLRAAGDGVVVHASSGHSAVTCRAAGIVLSGLSLVHSGGDPAKRGRSSARCVEVFAGDVSMIRCEVRSDVGSGIIVADTGSVSVQGSVLQGCGKCGVLVFDGGNLLCTDSIVSRNGLYGMVTPPRPTRAPLRPPGRTARTCRWKLGPKLCGTGSKGACLPSAT